MFGLGKLAWLIGGPVTVSIFGALILKNVQEMLWSGAPGVVRGVGFRLGSGRNRHNDAGK